MNFYEMHIEGGIHFMAVLSILLLAVVATGVVSILRNKASLQKKKWITINQDLALFALVWGILGQCIGLFGAFEAIEHAGEVSQALLAGGLKISSYTTIYGLFIFLIGKIFKIIGNFGISEEGLR